MKTELEQALKDYKIKKDFDRDAIPTVWKLYQEWCKEHKDETRYFSTIQSYVLSKENIPDELHEQLHREIYLANHQEDRAKEQAKDIEMFANGYLKIPKPRRDEPKFEYRGNIEIVASKDNDMFTHRIVTTGKIITDGRGEAFFIPKGKRSRGYTFQLLNGYYKLIN